MSALQTQTSLLSACMQISHVFNSNSLILTWSTEGNGGGDFLQCSGWLGYSGMRFNWVRVNSWKNPMERGWAAAKGQGWDIMHLGVWPQGKRLSWKNASKLFQDCWEIWRMKRGNNENKNVTDKNVNIFRKYVGIQLTLEHMQWWNFNAPLMSLRRYYQRCSIGKPNLCEWIRWQHGAGACQTDGV